MKLVLLETSMILVLLETWMQLVLLKHEWNWYCWKHEWNWYCWNMNETCTVVMFCILYKSVEMNSKRNWVCILSARQGRSENGVSVHSVVYTLCIQRNVTYENKRNLPIMCPKTLKTCRIPNLFSVGNSVNRRFPDLSSTRTLFYCTRATNNDKGWQRSPTIT